MSLRQFIREHRDEIDEAIDSVLGKGRGKRNDNERREWVLNDEGLYNYARSYGVRI